MIFTKEIREYVKDNIYKSNTQLHNEIKEVFGETFTNRQIMKLKCRLKEKLSEEAYTPAAYRVNLVDVDDTLIMKFDTFKYSYAWKMLSKWLKEYPDATAIIIDNEKKVKLSFYWDKDKMSIELDNVEID